jgi:hypothetical protein
MPVGGMEPFATPLVSLQTAVLERTAPLLPNTKMKDAEDEGANPKRVVGQEARMGSMNLFATPSPRNDLSKSVGLSALDARERIAKAGSLKDRMAALQGGSVSSATISPMPVIENPKWKAPPEAEHRQSKVEASKLPFALSKSPHSVPTSPPMVSESLSFEDVDAIPLHDAEAGANVGHAGSEKKRQRCTATVTRRDKINDTGLGIGVPQFNPSQNPPSKLYCSTSTLPEPVVLSAPPLKKDDKFSAPQSEDKRK